MNQNEDRHKMLSSEGIRTISIDIETFSPADLSTAGVYRYAEHPASELLLFSYSVNSGPIKLVDIAMGENIPDEILQALVDDDVEKWAFNANFERVFLSHWLRRHYPELLQKSGYTAVSSSASDGSPMVGVSPRSLPASRANSQSSDSALGGRYIGETRIHHGSMSARIGNTPVAMHSADCGDASTTDTSDIASELLIKGGYPIQEDRGIYAGAGRCCPELSRFSEESACVTLRQVVGVASASTPAEKSQHASDSAEKLTEKTSSIGSEDKSQRSLFLKPDSWRCSMVWSAYLGLPQSLDKVTKVLDLPLQKLEDGSHLIRFFCSPATSALDGPATRQWEPGQTAPPLYRHLPQHHPEEWSRFRAYNKRDVEVELALRKRLEYYPVPQKIWREYAMDQRINDCGMKMDGDFVKHAREMADMAREKLLEELKSLTGLENPNSVVQWKQWLASQGIHTDKADHNEMEKLLENPLLPSEIRPMIEKKLQLSHNSLKKYDAMESVMCADGSARGMYRFYGANRTGRFSGHLIQFQNLPRTEMEDTEKLENLRNLVRSGDSDVLTTITDNIPDTLSRLIRTAFVSRDGYRLFVADFSAIEARILAHLAGESWREEVFASGKDLYCASASRMFGVVVEKDGENAHLRRYGKIAELALGYGGSVGALQAMGAGKFITAPEELSELVKRWRESNTSIVSYWRRIENAVKDALQYGSTVSVMDIHICVTAGMLQIQLPSGRSLCYPRVAMQQGKYGPEITYMGMAKGSWIRQRTYGARLVENIVQGIARDVLTEAMMRLERTHPEWRIVGHVHDEIILECPPGTDMSHIIGVMTQSPAWMPDLQLDADGYVSDYYKK